MEIVDGLLSANRAHKANMPSVSSADIAWAAINFATEYGSMSPAIRISDMQSSEVDIAVNARLFRIPAFGWKAEAAEPVGRKIAAAVLLNKPAKKARTREALLAKYIFFHHPLFAAYSDNIIELADSNHSFLMPKEDDDRKITLEGGDIMVVSDNHLLVGVSERTSSEAAVRITNTVFEKGLMEKVTIIKIPKKRDYMHIDTIFTQVKRDVWVMLGNFSRKAVKHEDEDVIERILEIKKEEKIKILQFHKKCPENPVSFESLEDLFVDISRNDLHCENEVRFIYSGNNEFPYNAREQWTDSCNLLALKEGVVLGYDRNDKTTEAFKNAGFAIIHVKELLQKLEDGTMNIDSIFDTLILMPSAELSRARGGFHCMSMPLCREAISK